MAKIYEVTLNTGARAYFTSLAAIYTKFTEEEIGCKVTRLWNAKIAQSGSFSNKKCTIVAEELISKNQNK